MRLLIIILTSTLLHSMIFAQSQAVELGQVNWLRNYDQALLEAKRSNKDILILFQEVPGCATCVNYGQNVLSHPLLVDAIENQFVPLAIYNNVKGHDKKILKKYNEPTWNNPVVRMVDKEGKDIQERLNGDYSQLGLLEYILNNFEDDQDIPLYLKLLHEEIVAGTKRRSKTYFEMYCFWSGEAHLGNLDGVISTTPGFMNNAEVVEVKYDSDVVSENKLVKHALSAECEKVENVSEFKEDSDPQYYLKRTNYRFIPLSPIQKTKINAALANKESASKYLSPQQLKWLQNMENPEHVSTPVYDKDFVSAWQLMPKT